MKIRKEPIIILIIISSFILARPDSETNISSFAQIKSKYSEQQQIIDNDKTTFLSIPAGQQKVIELEFKPIFYLRDILIYFKPGKVPLKMTIEKKINRTAQYQIVKDLRVRGKLENGLFLVQVNMDSLAARQLRIIFPESVEQQIEIAEIEIYPNMQVWPEGQIQKPLIVTDKEAYLSFEAEQEMQTIFQLENGDQISKTASISSGRQHNIWLHGLTPATNYRVRVLMQNYLGNIDESTEISFRTKKKNLALNKKVTGTFDYYQPDDEYVSREQKDPLKLINDGDDSYFTSMATSGDPDKQEQFISLDLGSKKRAEAVVIVWRALAYSKEYQIAVSNDNKDWQITASSLNARDGHLGYSRTGDPVRVIEHQLDKSFRFLKIIIPHRSDYYVADPGWRFVQIMELKVF